MTLIDLNRAKELLSEAINIRGEDYRDPNAISTGSPGCAYYDLDEGAPGCGVGLALSLAGVTDYALSRMDGEGSIVTVVDNGLIPGDLELTPEAVEYFSHFQDMQDAGKTWGEARKFAEKSSTL